MTDREFAQIVYRALLMITHALERRWGFGHVERIQPDPAEVSAATGVTSKERVNRH